VQDWDFWQTGTFSTGKTGTLRSAGLGLLADRHFLYRQDWDPEECRIGASGRPALSLQARQKTRRRPGTARAQRSKRRSGPGSVGGSFCRAIWETDRRTAPSWTRNACPRFDISGPLLPERCPRTCTQLLLKKRAGAPGPRVHSDRSDVPVQEVWGDHSAEPSGKLTDERHLAGPGMHVHIID